MSTIKLTEYSHGAGCGCKIAPALLDQILKTDMPLIHDDNLLVGNASKDDAAAYDLGNGTAVLSTTDFFLPIVDDPFTFGRIASTNALSDIYAMGGKPLIAIAIVGWPIDKLGADVAAAVVDGGLFGGAFHPRQRHRAGLDGAWRQGNFKTTGGGCGQDFVMHRATPRQQHTTTHVGQRAQGDGGAAGHIIDRARAVGRVAARQLARAIVAQAIPLAQRAVVNNEGTRRRYRAQRHRIDRAARG